VSGLTVEKWHRRFEFQARWTQEVRSYLFNSYKVQPSARILEAGCGTGAVLSAVSREFPASYFGIDIDRPRLIFAHTHKVPASLASASVVSLPFAGDTFDGVFCHYFLLWVRDPLKTINEMTRIVKPGGFVAALAEPDYRGRIDYPEILVELGRQQAQALIDQGADVEMGRRLAEIFSSAGLAEIQVGIMGARWDLTVSNEDFESEWALIEEDLAGKLPPVRLEAYKNADFTSRQLGERILFLPTFYAIGRVQDFENS
jgi:SAM-dependent methyltransferase